MRLQDDRFAVPVLSYIFYARPQGLRSLSRILRTSLGSDAPRLFFFFFFVFAAPLCPPLLRPVTLGGWLREPRRRARLPAVVDWGPKICDSSGRRSRARRGCLERRSSFRSAPGARSSLRGDPRGSRRRAAATRPALFWRAARRRRFSPWRRQTLREPALGRGPQHVRAARCVAGTQRSAHARGAPPRARSAPRRGVEPPAPLARGPSIERGPRRTLGRASVCC